MFLVYGLLSDDGKSGRKAGKRELPTIAFFAYPLVDQTSFSEQMLLNTRTMGNLQQGAEEDRRPADHTLSEEDDNDDYIQYENPAVDSIMNGYDDDDDDDEQESGYESDWTGPFDMEANDGKSLFVHSLDRANDRLGMSGTDSFFLLPTDV